MSSVNQLIAMLMAWDYADRMKAFYVWTGGTSDPTTYGQYGYDASGQRVMKVVRVAGGAYRVRIYIGSIFEDSNGVMKAVGKKP